MVALSASQTKIYKALFVDKTCRNVVAVCPRGWGKSYFAATTAATAIWELLQLHKNVPDKNVYIIAPTYSQVTDIYYPLLQHQLGIGQYAIHSSQADGYFEFPKNVTLNLLSYEAIERMRGMGAYYVVNDEVSSWTKGVGFQEAWQGVIEPCIATRWSPKRARTHLAQSPGRSLTISTPKGYNYFYDMFNYQETDPIWRSFQFDYHSSSFLDPEEIERLKHSIDPLKFRREYLARFEDSGNSVFYCFDRKIHVRNDLPYFAKSSTDAETVHVNIDFNVGLQCTSAMAIRGGQVHILDEFKGHPDTDQLGIYLKEKFKGHRILAYPDPSGRSRKTSATVGVTDFSILESHGIKCLAPKAAPSIMDSVNIVNRKLKSAAGDIEVFVHPRCKGVIESLERTVWVENNPDLAVISKKEGIEHFSDGIRYGFAWNFPIQNGQKRVARGFGF